jgi:phosphate transport system substrate-binding protein
MIYTAFAILLAAAIGPLHAQSEPPTVRHDGTRPNTKTTETQALPFSTRLSPAWIDEYTSLHPGARILYQSIGSGGGIQALTNRKISFATSNGPMTDDQLARAPGRILHLPVALDAVVPIYNLVQVPHLRLSSDTLAGIFLGKITKWDDPAIATDNPGLELPRMGIKVAHEFQNPGQHDTFYLADYLSKVSPAFRDTRAHSSSWPLSNAGEGHLGGAGVTGFIAETPGSIGYVWWDRARHSSLQQAAVKNSDGEFVMASPESLTAAAAAIAPLMRKQAPDLRILITNAPGETSYPISYFIWLIFYEDSPEKKQHQVMTDFVKWALTDGQKVAVKLGFPALPYNVVKLELQRLGVSTK